MAERYSKTFSLVTNLYTAGSPLIIAAGALLKDNTDGRIIAQLKFKNIQAKAVKLVKVAINSLDALGRPLGEETEYQYLDLNESRDKEFGSKNAIVLADSSARSFSARIVEVGFEDNSVWSAKENAVWSTLPAMEEIKSKYNGEVLTQVQLTYGKACKYLPVKEGDLWICSCGALNSNSEQNCHSCNCSKTDILYIDYSEMEIAAQKRVTAAKNDSIYASAIKTASLKEFDKPFSTVNLEKAIVELETIPDWKDSKAKIAEFKAKIQELKDKEKAEKEAAAKKAKKNKIIAAITIPLVIAAIAFLIVLFKVIIPSNNYDDATALLEEGNIVEAYEALIALGDYKDSAEKASSIYSKYKIEKLKNTKVEVGDYVLFGAYEQDNNTSNGKEDIEWLVLDVKDGKALVISKYALDCKPYNTSYTDVTWETCTLRKWLNSNFISSAFTADEKAMIPTVTVSADKNPNYSTNPGNATQDQVFLLSITEANKYFSSYNARQCEATEYAVAGGAYVYSYSVYCWWWLRSPGGYQNNAVYVDDGGNVDVHGHSVFGGTRAVRPAMWIEIE